MKGTEDGEVVVWVAKVLLLFRLNSGGPGQDTEYAYVQYIVVTDAVSAVHRNLGCVCLRCAKEDEVDRTVNISQNLRGSQMEAGEYYGMVPFRSILSCVQVLRSNIGIRPFTEQFPWPLHRFYLNLFYTTKVLQLPDETD